MDEWKEFIMEVRQNKAQLIEMYGGITGLRKHQQEERPNLEQKGWKFVSLDEMNAMRNTATRPCVGGAPYMAT